MTEMKHTEPVAWLRKSVLMQREYAATQGKPLPRSAFIRMKRPTIETESEYVALYATQPVTNHNNEITAKATKVTP